MKKRMTWIAGIGLAALAVRAQPPDITLKFATLAPEGSAWMQAFDAAREEISTMTGGKVMLRVYPAGVLGAEKDVLFKIKVGQVDGGAFIGAGVGSICPDARALMFPLLFTTYEEVEAVFAALQPDLEKQCRENGFIALGWTEVGFSYLFSVKPVRTLNDLRAAKPWLTPGEQMLNELFSAARINAVPVTVADVLTSLQTGLIQTIYSPPLAAVAMQWHTRVRYRNDLRLTYAFGGVFLADRAWKKLTTEQQAVIQDVFRRRAQELTGKVRSSDAEALRVMEGQGIQTLASSAADLEDFHAVARTALAKLEGQLFSVEASRRVQETLKKVRGAGDAGGHGS